MIWSLGYWSQDTSLIFPTAANTRSLSVALIGNGSLSTNTTTNSALLYYENPNGNISALLRRGDPLREDAQWIDITSQGSESLPDEFRNTPSFNVPTLYTNGRSRTLYESDTDATFNTPFRSGASFPSVLFYDPTCAGISSCTAIGAIGLENYSSSNATLDNGGSPEVAASFVYTTYTIGFSGPGNFSSGMHRASLYVDCDLTSAVVVFQSSGTYASMYRSDIAGFGTNSSGLIWINGTRPTFIALNPESGVGGPTIDNVFPFARLASVNSADQSSTFLYHQINGTTLAEEEWDASSNAWLSSVNITVSDL